MVQNLKVGSTRMMMVMLMMMVMMMVMLMVMLRFKG